MEQLNAMLFKRKKLESVPKLHTNYTIHLKSTKICIHNSTVPKSDFYQIVIIMIENSDEYCAFRSTVNSFSLPISETKWELYLYLSRGPKESIFF